LALLGQIGNGATPDVFEQLGLSVLNTAAGPVKVVKRSEWVGYEREPVPRIDYLPVSVRSVSNDHAIHLSMTDVNNSQFDLVGTTPWGAFGTTKGLVDFDPDGYIYWVVDPFAFIKSALKLPNIPQPDVTTQTGRRIATAHIDGDALPSWAEMPGRRLGAEVLYEDIIKRYQFPHSISIVEGEMTGFIEYLDRKKRMFDVMQEMFRDDNVELATHTYSHPFKWYLLNAESQPGQYNLRIPGYQYSIEREIDGSIDFINRELAPSNKKVETVFWTGDAYPGEDALARVEALGLQNINGGNTTITKAFPGLERISPMIRPVGPYDQIYAPIMNENVYTNDWTGPYDGFRRPIGIYYHFYSGTKISAMQAMREVFDWTVKQDIAPIFVSEYSKRVTEFRNAQVSRSLDGEWSVAGLNTIQSIRWLNETKEVDVANSDGITGQRRLHDGLYIHPASSAPVQFRLSTNSSRVPELVSSNGQVKSWERQGRSLSFRIEANVPVDVVLKNAAGCRLERAGGAVRGVRTEEGHKFSFTEEDTGNVSLRCPS